MAEAGWRLQASLHPMLLAVKGRHAVLRLLQDERGVGGRAHGLACLLPTLGESNRGTAAKVTTPVACRKKHVFTSLLRACASCERSS